MLYFNNLPISRALIDSDTGSFENSTAIHRGDVWRFYINLFFNDLLITNLNEQ